MKICYYLTPKVLNSKKKFAWNIQVNDYFTPITKINDEYTEFLENIFCSTRIYTNKKRNLEKNASRKICFRYLFLTPTTYLCVLISGD